MGCGNSRDQQQNTKTPFPKKTKISQQSTHKPEKNQKQISPISNQPTKLVSNHGSPQKSQNNINFPELTPQPQLQNKLNNKNNINIIENNDDDKIQVKQIDNDIKINDNNLGFDNKSNEQINNSDKINCDDDNSQKQEQKENYYDTHIVRVQPHFPAFVKSENKQQEEDNEEEKYTPIFNFSKTLKSKKLRIIGKDQKVCQSKGDNYQYILIDQPLNTKGKNLVHNINFKINSQSKGHNIFMGICHVETIKMSQFIKKKWFDEIDHGVYAIDDFRHCYSNVKEKFNNKKIIDWGFSQENDTIIQIQLSNKKKELTFQKYYQKKNYKPFVLPVSFSEIKNEGDLHFFVCVGGESQVQIIDDNDLHANLLL